MGGGPRGERLGGTPSMNGPGKSDRLIVPVKVPNNAVIAAAEVLEGRGLREGKAASKTRPGLRAGQGALSALVRMRRIAGVRGSTPSLKRGAQCGSSARWDLCGGRAEPSKRRPVPTATTTEGLVLPAFVRARVA